jgi:ferritin-like metal-binding protein YciE
LAGKPPVLCVAEGSVGRIATYGTLCSWAELLGFKNAKEQLGKNLNEEENADATLNKVSKTVNKGALAVAKE